MRSLPRLMQASTAAALLFLLAALVVSAQPAPPGDIVAAGLNQPRGMSIDGDDVLIAELGGGHIHRLSPDGTLSLELSGIPTTSFFSAEAGGDEAAGPSAVVAVPGGYAYTLSEAPEAGFQSVYFATGTGETVLVADMGAYEEANNTDGDTDLSGAPDLLSNPFDILPDGNGGLFVSDSGANAVLHVDADGEITPYAVFDRIDNPLFPDVGGPTMQQVPTGMAIGPDGALYVATLTGFPFPPGAASVYRVSSPGEMSVYATGFTALTDIAFDNEGHLLALSFSTNMLGEALGQLIHVEADDSHTVAVDGLITPTGVVVTPAGRVLVSQEFAGLVTDVTDVMTGEPTTPPTATPTTPPTAPPPASTGQGGLASSAAFPAALALLTAVAIMGVAGARRVTAARRID